MITGAELTAQLEAMGITPPPDVDVIAAQAVREWEDTTGYRPFVADAGETTQELDPAWEYPGFIMGLGGAFFTVSSITRDGAALTLNTDYNLLPLNAADDGRGYDRVRFLVHPGHKPRAIAVTGRRGLYETAPADAKRAVLALAVSLAVPASSLGLTLGGKVKQGEVEVGSSGTGLLQQNRQIFTSTARRYLRVW